MSNYNYIRHLNAFFSFVRNDNRLSCSHVSLYLALFQYWNFNRFNNPFPVYRDNLMQISKIGSKNTYHKCIRLLHETEYIIYHPPASKFQPVKISVRKLDGNQPATRFKQLELFNQDIIHKNGRLQSVWNTDSDTGNGSKLTDSSIINDTLTVPELGQNIKPNNKNNKNVLSTPTKIFDRNKKLNNEINSIANVPKQVHQNTPVTLEEVINFFQQHNYPVTEAHKFFYYNNGKNWMMNDRTPITNWQALSHKWMLNQKQNNIANPVPDPFKEIQYLYEKFYSGENIHKYLNPEYADYLKLTPTEEIQQEAIKRRINQLTGTNIYSEIKLLEAYCGKSSDTSLLNNDQPKLTALVKKLTLLKYFEHLKINNISCIQ